MTRQEEINEFNLMLGALAKKYNVALAVSIQDLQLNETKMVDENVETTPAEVPAVAPENA